MENKPCLADKDMIFAALSTVIMPMTSGLYTHLRKLIHLSRADDIMIVHLVTIDFGNIGIDNPISYCIASY